MATLQLSILYLHSVTLTLYLQLLLPQLSRLLIAILRDLVNFDLDD